MAPKPATAAAAAAEANAPPPPPTSGTGRFYYANGATYDGDWRLFLPETSQTPEDTKKKAPKPKVDSDEPSPFPPKRVRHGKGTYTEGAYSYTGDWEDDQMHGQGTFTFASGSSYTGAFVQGKYQGQGVYAWSDGRMYQGEWQEGRMHGPGFYKDTEGHQWNGQFFNGAGPGLTCQM